MQPRRIDIKVTSRAALDERLNAAIGRLQHVAMKERVGGILVTRHLPGHYVAELSSSVPFGLTQERTV